MRMSEKCNNNNSNNSDNLFTSRWYKIVASESKKYLYEKGGEGDFDFKGKHFIVVHLFTAHFDTWNTFRAPLRFCTCKR